MKILSFLPKKRGIVPQLRTNQKNQRYKTMEYLALVVCIVVNIGLWTLIFKLERTK